MIFERIFLRVMNQLYIHLRNLDIYPVDTACQWMMSFFIGFLAVPEVFQLADRLVGYNSLHLLPVFALAVFKYYEKNLLAIKSKPQFEESFHRLKDLNFLQVLNCFLFEK